MHQVIMTKLEKPSEFMNRYITAVNLTDTWEGMDDKQRYKDFLGRVTNKVKKWFHDGGAIPSQLPVRQCGTTKNLRTETSNF